MSDAVVPTVAGNDNILLSRFSVQEVCAHTCHEGSFTIQLGVEKSLSESACCEEELAVSTRGRP
jgi:hypothetical protein